MAVCLSCNGWGRVLRLNVPASHYKQEDRIKIFKRTVQRQQTENLQVSLAEQVCIPCGGLGEVPRGATTAGA